jgi:spore coat polysaccharide biosynthesis protein SpsF
MDCMIQARVGSTRFPNKIFSKIGGKSVLENVVRRIKKSKKIKRVVIATSKKREDKKIVNFCKKNKILYYTGSEKRVALRLLKAAQQLKTKSFVRICADSPFINAKLVDKVIKNYENNNVDISTNIFPRTFPKGQSVEVIRVSTLKKNITKFLKQDMEHVTTYFYKNSKKFKIFNLKLKKNLSKLNLCIDTTKDLNFLKKNLKLNKLEY